MSRTTLTLFLSLAALLCGGCRRGSESHVTIAGSTSIQPFVEMVAERFMAKRPSCHVAVQGGGSTAGIQAVRQGAAELGMCSRALHENESDLQSCVIARDGIAVIVHPSNPLDSLALDQVRDIFAGRVDDWSATGGGRGPIRLVTREEGSGTRGAFQDLVMGKDAISGAAMVQDSNGSVREVIANDPGGIGYISVGLVGPSVKALKIGGVAATDANILNHSYTLVRPFLFVYRDAPKGSAAEFMEFVLSPQGQQLLEEEGLVRAK